MTTGAQFKKTDIGLIPVDWTKLNLGKSASLKARIGWQGLTTAEYLDSGDYSLITGTDFKNGYIDWDNCVFVKKNRFDQDRNIQIKLNDVLVTKDGTIGKVALINKIKKPATLNSGVFVIRPISNSFNPKYFYYVLRSNHFKDFLEKLSAGSTINHLYQKDFVYYSFPLPPLPEQEAIAEVLSDTDTLIGTLEKRIAKKRLIKQGAMQTLLTPKDDWEVKKFDEVFEKLPTKNYQINSTDYLDYGKYPVIDQGKSKIVAFSNKLDKVFRCRNNGIIIFGDHTREIKFVDFDFIVGADGVQIIRPKVHYNTSFLYYLLLKQDIPNTGYNRHFKFLLEGKYYTPKSIEEQTRIATILSDIDNEIDALEKKLSKTKVLKQGLMQQLLTGKIRLV